VPVEDLPHLVGEPGPHVDAVRDVANRDLCGARVEHRGCHIARETWPCTDDTALARWLNFQASTVMQNVSFRSPAFTRPSAIS
jgi:hypothetical protein